MNQLEQLEVIRRDTLADLENGRSPEEVRINVLGRKGTLTEILRSLSSLPLAERVEIGTAANHLRQELEGMISEAIQSHTTKPTPLPDSTVPAYPSHYGSIHPIPAMIHEMTSIFRDLSFEVIEGSELVNEKDNFENLNIGPDHPARDGHASFYAEGGLLLRTQTTAVQVMEMSRRVKQDRLPLRVVVPGKTYRRESDPTHSPMFHQFDAVMVDTQTTFSDLKGILGYFAQRLFGDLVETRFRPHYFPFTEPSAEMDIHWKGEAKGTGKHTQWLEFGGCGMIHPAVLKRAGINPRIYQGWAFGMAIERPIMVRNQVPDLRLFFENQVSFLNQFSDIV